MPIVGAFVMPHPPVVLPEVGGGREREIMATARACREVARGIALLRPDVIVLASPHSALYADYFHISPGQRAQGDLGRFGAKGVRVEVEYDSELARELEVCAQRDGIGAGTLGERGTALDHGTVIPLTFVNEAYKNYKLVRIGLAGLPVADHYRLGQCIAKSVDVLGRHAVFIASGDLSHKVAADGPYGFAPEGVKFDRLVTRALANGDFLSLMTLPPELAEAAAECGLRSLVMMAGALDGLDVTSELLSYEGTFGVGYGVAAFAPRGQSPDRALLGRYFEHERGRMQGVRESEDAYVRLARASLEHYIGTGEYMVLPDDLPSELAEKRAGVFVSIKKHGELRGCIGTIAPAAASIAEEIIRNAVSAGVDDPRFDRVRGGELQALSYSVDVLLPPERISSEDELDVRRYGVILTSGHKRGLLLPNLDGVDSVREQVDIAMRKGGIREGETVELQRFEVVRHT